MVMMYFNKRNPRSWLKLIGWILLGLAGMSVFAIVFGYVVMHLWNWLMPELFDLPVITFWQAVGIILLARLIFGGFKHGHNKHGGHKGNKWYNKGKYGKYCGDWSYYSDYWKEKGEADFKSYVEKRKSVKAGESSSNDERKEE